jgi:hypothetical protein
MVVFTLLALLRLSTAGLAGLGCFLRHVYGLRLGAVSTCCLFNSWGNQKTTMTKMERTKQTRN